MGGEAGRNPQGGERGHRLTRTQIRTALQRHYGAKSEIAKGMGLHPAVISMSLGKGRRNVGPDLQERVYEACRTYLAAKRNGSGK